MKLKPMLQAARGQKPSRYPIWFMRQAGRYLPEYREVRSKVDFVTLCKTPALTAEVTLQPLRRYDLDAAIIFSDILIPCIAMGQTLTFDKGEGPVLTSAIRTSKDLLSLKVPQAERDLGYVGEGILNTKQKMNPNQAMIGFAGAPFTVASYMIEGSGSKTFTEVKKMLLKEQNTFKELLKMITETTVDYLLMQAHAGADIVMLFDTWAGQLTSADYRTLVFPHVQEIASKIRAQGIPFIYFPGQGSDRLFDLRGIEVDALSIDWRISLVNAARVLSEQRLWPTLQGNLDPQYLLSDPIDLEAKVQMLLNEAQTARMLGIKGHIFNVGHGLLPHTPPEALSNVIDVIRKCEKYYLQ
jgi:uroporphyrinogen decarboxylase